MSRERTRSLKVGLDLGEAHGDPGAFKDAVVLSEKLGFDVAWLGDHFMPWVESAGRSAFVWSLIGSSLEATKKIKVGPYVTTPIGGRYHPALVAQASATLDNMYPGRFVLGVGTGEAVNEAPFMEWPAWKERMARLLEGIRLMRELWTKRSHFDFKGRFFSAKGMFLYTKPSGRIPILMSSIGPKSAGLAGKHADGIITLGSRNSPEKISEVVLSGFDQGARESGKDLSKLEKVVSVSFTLERQGDLLRKPRGPFGNLAKGAVDASDPREIERMGLKLSDEALLQGTTFCRNWEEVAELIHKFEKIGATQVVLPAGADKKVIRTLAKELLPLLRG